MNTISKPPADALALIVKGLMHGETLPDASTDRFEEFTNLVRQTIKGDGTVYRFGALILEALLDHGKAHVETAQIMHRFGGDAFGDRGQA